QGPQAALSPGGPLPGDSAKLSQVSLQAAALPSRYLIIRTLPVDTLDLSPATRLALAGNPLVQAFHRELLRRLRAKNAGATALLAMGPGARRLAPAVGPAGLGGIDLAAPREPALPAPRQAAPPPPP